MLIPGRITPFQIGARLGVIAFGQRLVGQEAPKRINIGKRIVATAGGTDLRLRPLSRQSQLAEIAIDTPMRRAASPE